MKVHPYKHRDSLHTMHDISELLGLSADDEQRMRTLLHTKAVVIPTGYGGGPTERWFRWKDICDALDTPVVDEASKEAARYD